MSSNFNNAKIINVYYTKGDRKPYDVNGKPIAYIGEEYIGANEATELRFHFGEELDSASAIIVAKRANGDTRLDPLELVGTGVNSYFKVTLNAWYAEYKGKMTIIFKVYNGTVTYDDPETPTQIVSTTGQIIVSDIFNLEVAYAPNASSLVPPFETEDYDDWFFTLSTKLDKAQSITVVGALPTLTGGVYDDRYFYVEDEGVGRLYYINGSTAIECVFGLGQLNFATTNMPTATLTAGQMRYNDTTGSLDLGLKGDHILKVGETVIKRVRNDEVVNLKVGQMVYVSGAVGNSGLLLVKKASNLGESTSSKTFGMVATAMNTTSTKDGYVYIYGLLQGIDLTDTDVSESVFSSGDVGAGLWLGENGKITKTLPTADNKHSVFIGYLDTYGGAGSNCSIYVKIQNGYELGELHDVRVSAIADNQILRYNSTRQVWENTNELTTAESNIANLQGRMTTEEANVDNLQSRMTTAEADIENIEDGTTIVGKAYEDENGDNIEDTYLKQVNASATYIPLSQKGANNGVVPLNSNGKISSIYLSGEQDDFIEFANLASFPLVGEADIIYCAIDTGLIYRWTGSTYAVISPSLALGTTATTAFRGDLGQSAYDNADTALDNTLNIIDGTQTLTNTRITNSAIGTVPAIVNAITGTTAVLQEWQINGTANSRITNSGYLSGLGLLNFSNSNNGSVVMLNAGTSISRNIADANPSLIVNQANASSTGDILRLQFAGANKLEITKDGFINQNGTRFILNPGTQNIFVGETSGNTTLTGAENTGVGRSSLSALTSGGSNVGIGRSAFALLTTGSSNTTIGGDSGRTITTGSNNTFVGYSAGFNASQLATAQNSTAIGQGSYTDKSNQMVFGNASVSEFVFNRNTGATALLPLITASSGDEHSLERTTTGTASPINPLLLRATSTNDMVDGFGGRITFQIRDNANVTNAIARVGALRSGADNSGRLIFNTINAGTDTEKMTILPDGKVGIGTTSPDALLTLKSTDTQIRLYSTSPTSNQYATFSFNSAGNNTLDISTGYNNDANKITFSPKNVTSMTLLGSGRVGIGTIAPDKQLEVQTANGTESAFRLRQLSQNYWDIRIPAGTTNLIINDVSAERLRIDSTGGQVGINETSPTAQLQVKSGATTRVPLIVDSLSTHATNLAEFRVGGAGDTRAYIDLNGWYWTNQGIINLTSSNNARVQVGTNGTVIQRNIADTNPALIVNLANSSATGNIQVWQKAGTAVANITDSGYFQTTQGYGSTGSFGLYFTTNANQASVNVASTGITILRNINDANVTLKVRQQNTSASGRLQEWIYGSDVVSSVEKDGIANFAGTPSNAQTVDYTLVLSDKGKVVRINSSSNLTVTIPLNSSVAFPIDTELAILRYGTGTVSISPTSGVTLNSKNSERKISGQYGSVALKKIGTDEWVLVGSLEA